MLPEQRGILSSLKSWLRSSASSKTRAKRAKARHRSPQLEALEPRQVLTATIYVDFGDRLGTETHSESEWLNLGLTVPQNELSWINGPAFPYAGNPNITYTPFDVPQNFPIDFGPNFGGEPWEFETGPELPISKEDAAQIAIVDTLQRMVAPFNIQVLTASATNLGDVRNTLARNNRLTDPYETIKQMPSADMYNLTNANPAGLQPTGFNPLQLDPSTGAPAGMKDVYIFVGNWTRNGIEIGTDPGNGTTPVSRNFGFGNLDNTGPSYVDPFTTDPAKPMDPLFSGIPITYSEGSGAVLADTIMGEVLAGKTELITAVATVAAQQAGYSYGLFHTQDGKANINNPFFDPDVDLLSSSDMMREGRHENLTNPQPSLDDVAVFSRLPLMLGDLNQIPALQQSAYDTLINNPDVGPNTGTIPVLVDSTTGLSIFANILSVTGTGASDRITIVSDPANPLGAIVTVDAYRTGEMLPGDLIDSFTYNLDFTLPAGVLSNSLFIDAGRGDDQIEIDPTIAGLVGTSVEIFGGGGKDNISFTGTGTEDVDIAVANVDSFRFNKIEKFLTQVQIGGFVAILYEFNDDSTIHLENFNQLTYNLPQFLPSNFSVTAQQGSNLAIPPAGNGVNMVIDGTAGPTQASPVVNVANIEFTNVNSVAIQSLAGLTADTLTISSDLGFADGLQNFGAALGPGSDSLILTGTNFALPVAGGVFFFDGGAGKDTVSATGDTDWTLIDGDAATFTDGMLICGGGGTITLQNMIGDNAVITGGASDNAITIESWTGDLTINGLGGNDTLTFGTATKSVGGQITALGGADDDVFNLVNLLAATFSIDGGAGIDTFEMGAMTGTGSLLGNIGNDLFHVNVAAGLTVTIDGGNDSDTFEIDSATGGTASIAGSAGNDIFNVNSLAAGNVTLDGGTGIDTFNINSMAGLNTTVNGGDANDTFNVNDWAGAGTLNGGIGNDTFNLNKVTGMATVNGDAGLDTFNIKNWAGTGSMNGGVGNDVFTVTKLTGDAAISGDDDNDTFTVNDWSGTGSASGGAANDTFQINNWSGANGAVFGNDGDDVFNIKLVSATIFSIDGGTGIDRFELDTWTGTGSALGGDGNDIFHIKAPAGLNVTIDGGNNNDTFDINSWLGAGSVAGGAGNDTFNINTITFANFSLDAGAGADTVTATGDTNWTLINGTTAPPTDGMLISGGGGVVTLKNMIGDTAIITGGAGNNAIKVDSWSGPLTVSGLGGNDTFTLGTATTGVSGKLTALGGAGNDTFQINNWSGVGGLSGEADNDNFFLVGSANLTTKPDISGGPGIDGFTLDDSLLTSDIDYVIHDFAITSKLAGFAGVNLAAFENVTVNGTQGANTFDVTPSLAVAFRVNGDGAVGGENILNVDFTVTTDPKPSPTLAPPGVGNGAWTFSSGHKPVVFTSMDSRTVPLGFPENAFLAIGSSQGKGSKPLIKVYDSKTNALLFSFYAYETSFTGGVRVALGDVTGDGVDDIVAAPGPGRAGQVKVFDGRGLFAAAAAGKALVTAPTFALVGGNAFYPDGKSYKSGLYVAAADVDGDGSVDVVTSTQAGAGKIRVFAYDGAFSQSLTFVPYSSADKVKTGAVVTTADVDGDGVADIITAPGGAGTAAIIKVFDGSTGAVLRKFNGFESSFKNGVSIAAADVDGDGFAEIMVGAGTNGKSRVRVLDGSGTLLKEFKAVTTGSTTNAPLTIAAHDVDGQIELFVAQNNSATSHKIMHFDPLTGSLIDSFLEKEVAFKPGLNLG